MRLFSIIVLIALLSCMAFPSSIAGQTPSQDIEFTFDECMVTVIVQPNGRINVTYWMTFSVTSGSLGGFDIVGISETGTYDRDRAYVMVGSEREDLQVGSIVGGYSLDWNRRIQAGETGVVVFGYFSIERIVMETTRDGKDLGVLNWAPVQWNVPIGVEQVTVVYPIEMEPSWIADDGGILPAGADYAGYVVDSRQGIWTPDDSSRMDFDFNELLAYPSAANASPRYFSVSMKEYSVPAEYHFRIFHYTDWAFYAEHLGPGQLDYYTQSYINTYSDQEFALSLSVYNIGDATLEDVVVKMTLPDNITLIEGSLVTDLGVLPGGRAVELEYKMIAGGAAQVYNITFQVSASGLNFSDWLEFMVSVYVSDYVPPI